jgi:Ser/Thr protein kinase RdoA (MazF antagonist)
MARLPDQPPASAAPVQADGDAKLLLTGYLPGHLVEGSDHERQPETYRQAGELLARFHAQTAVRDEDFEARIQQKTLIWLDGSHRIDPDLVVRLRAIVRSWPTASAVLVPTHGDWQPRNWLVHDDVISVIDFGRADLRPAMTDFTRLAAQQFRDDPTLEAAFWSGYGPDPREPETWQRHRLYEAILTAVWAYQVGDEAFEAQGHRMIAEALPG